MKTLQNKKPDKDVKDLVELINKAHEKRMEEEDDEEMEVTKEDFEELLSRLGKKDKRSYDILIKSGTGFKSNVLKLCQRLIKAEQFPTRFFKTVLHQSWKKKLPRESLANHKLIHMKDWLPRCCEALLVTKMKPNILEAGSKYQIGGLPNHRVEEHLIVLKALIERDDPRCK